MYSLSAFDYPGVEKRYTGINPLYAFESTVLVTHRTNGPALAVVFGSRLT